MAGSQVKIHGKGHSLCLTRTLQASYEDETFSDVRIAGFVHGVNDDDGDFHFIRANRAVLAAASPIFATILETATEEETTVVLTGCSRNDINNLVRYIYTGKAFLSSPDEREKLSSIFKELRIGEVELKKEVKAPLSLATDNCVVFNSTITTQPQVVKHVKPSNQTSKPNSPAIHSTVKKPSTSVRKISAYPPRPLTLTMEDVTIKDPLTTNHEHLKNLDVLRPQSILEKSVVKYGVLGDADSSLNDHVFDYPRLADRLGIYFDPHLANYYRALLRSSPPIRIFLDIDNEWAESHEVEDSVVVKKPTFTYGKGTKRNIAIRKTFCGNRFQLKSVYFDRGKKHLMLDDEMCFKDDSIPQINYPPSDDEFAVNYDCIPDSIEVEAEVRRKRSLLSTLSQLKEDHRKAKRVAQQILKTKQATNQIQEKKSSQRTVVCEICGKLISSSWIRVHFANHLGEKNYLCEHCGRSFASATLLKSHVHYQHNSQITTFKCAICNKAFTKKSRLDIHKRIHNDERPYSCPVIGCGKSFHTNGNLRKHSFVHTGEKPHKCNHCDKAFAQLANLRLHLRSHDQTCEEKSEGHKKTRKQEAVFSCDFCPMTFSRKRHFLTHRASHTGERTTVQCSSCDKAFADILELKQHKVVEHPGTVHKCSLCDKTFFKKTAMLRHQAIHAEGMIARSVYKCQHCNSHFSTAAARTVHERLHTGERPFSCPVCAKAFTSKYNFRQHLRMHSEDRPFKCSQCNKAFRQPQHLRAHTYIHKSEGNPVPCPECGKLFKNKILVMSHKRIHKQKHTTSTSLKKDSLPTAEIAVSHQEQEHEPIQLMDPNVGFVNILVLTGNPELP